MVEELIITYDCLNCVTMESKAMKHQAIPNAEEHVAYQVHGKDIQFCYRI